MFPLTLTSLFWGGSLQWPLCPLPHISPVILSSTTQNSDFVSTPSKSSLDFHWCWRKSKLLTLTAHQSKPHSHHSFPESFASATLNYLSLPKRTGCFLAQTSPSAWNAYPPPCPLEPILQAPFKAHQLTELSLPVFESSSFLLPEALRSPHLMSCIREWWSYV